MMRCVTAAVVVGLCCGAPSFAGDTKSQKPIGSWTRSEGDLQVRFDFTADTLKCSLAGGGLTLTVDADYGISKEGVVFGRISKVDGGGGGPKVGDVFTFKVRLKGDTLTISELGPDTMADARTLVEGDYMAAKKKK